MTVPVVVVACVGLGRVLVAARVGALDVGLLS
ncbi:hypothetical protein EDD35_0266 [Amycolatopsis thermoflava]|uniref:Uncharacterized protein n=1 Tax=Amycolatopsis thermoflava TaxID=84480 RepID=A0A3N2GN39_9PSEU|nr:hypothetical protein EDD35_0266 [Amycolatopsis thermoflava]